ncbi:uncharacterized protein LOC144662994 isoform X2 [Oculina patagonica]
MSRRRKSGTSELSPKDKKTEGDASKTEWSEEEKSRLLDALKIDEGNKNWRWIARQVKTKTTAQVKEFASKLETEKPASNKRAIAPKDDSPLEAWINVTKRLKGDDDVDGTCIPQNKDSRTQEHTDSPGKEPDVCNKQMDQDHNSDGDANEEQQDPAADDVDHKQGEISSKSDHSNKLQKTGTVLEDLLTNQKQMMEKISILDSKLEKLCSESSQTTVMELLTKINNRLDELGKNPSHSCCGGPVIIQTTPHANVVHQPVLDSCSSCKDSRKEKRSVSFTSFPSEGSSCFTSREKDDHQVSASSLNLASIRTSSDLTNASEKNVSGNQPGVILVSDSQDEPSPKPQTVAIATSSPGVTCTSHFHSVPSVVESTVSENKQGSSLATVSCERDTRSKVNKSVYSEQALPSNREPSPNGNESSLVIKEGSSLPNGTNSVASIANQSAIATTVSATSLQTKVTSVLTQPRDLSHQAEYNKTLTPRPQQIILPSSHAGTSYPPPVQIIPAPSQQSPYVDHQTGSITNRAEKNEPAHKTGHEGVTEIVPCHQRPPTVCPVSVSTVVRSPTPHYYPAVMSPGPSHYLSQQALLVVNSSGARVSAQNSSDQQFTRIPLDNATPSSVQKDIPSGYITLSHAANVMSPSPNKVHATPAWQPQTVMTATASHSTQQEKELHVSSATGAATQKSDDVKSRQSKASQKDLLNAAMLINNYVLEHPNQENQTQWQSCLNAIVADYQKNNPDPARGDLLQLVTIGHNPHVLLTKYELEDAVEKSKGRPKFYALRLAEKLFGLDVLIKSTPYGIGGKAALNPVILDAIKREVLQKFAQHMSSEEKRNLWKGCVTSIAQRCKRARNPQRKRSSKRVKRSEDNDDRGPPSMAVGNDMQHDERDDSLADSDEEYEEFDMDTLDQPGSSHTPPSTVRISSDSEQEEPPQNGARDGVDHSETHHLKQAQDSNVPSESTADSREDSEDTEQDVSVPPGIDPDITVVHLPSTMQTAVKVSSKQADQTLSPGLLQRNSVEASGSENSPCVRPEGLENLGAYTVRIQETYQHVNDGDSPEKNVAMARKYYGDFPPVVGSIYKPGPASTESVIVSGIKMTPDFSYVLIGGNPNVTLPRQKYLDCLTRSGQPTHFAVRLAELAFGDDVLKASTVTGGKRGTLQLDPNVIDAIQTEVSERFLKEVRKEEQTAVLRKCITSIATRCKTLRYNRSKSHVDNHWTIHTSHTGDV